MDDLAIRVSDSEPDISPVSSTRLVVGSPSLTLSYLHRLLSRTVLSRDDFTAGIVDEGEVNLEHD